MPFLPPLPAAVTPGLVYQITVSVFAGYSLVNAVGDWFTFKRAETASLSGKGSPPPTPLLRKEGEPEGERVIQPSTVSASRPSGSPSFRRRGVGGGDPFPLNDAVSLSVLIPARNEEATIAPCVRSLLAQEYAGTLEILVLDDHSTDKTAEVVAGLSREDARVRLISGGPLLDGWKGKPNALRQLVEHATGEMLLLTDADCVFFPGALVASVAHRERVGADCLSLLPNLPAVTFWEKVIIPLQAFLVFATLPVRNVSASPNPAFAAANGAFLLLSASLYRELGGHEAVRGEMAEDIKFAQHVKKRGKRLVYGDGAQIYSVRMYTSFADIWAGFAKNLYPALGSVPVLIVWSLFLITTQILPFGFLAVALARGDRGLAGFYLPLAHIVIALGIRLALAVRFRQSLPAVLTHPLGWIITVAIAYYSAYLALSGRGHRWKGRVYTP